MRSMVTSCRRRTVLGGWYMQVTWTGSWWVHHARVGVSLENAGRKRNGGLSPFVAERHSGALLCCSSRRPPRSSSGTLCCSSALLHTFAYFVQRSKGKFAVLEHPAPPSKAHPDAPSIWYLTAIRLLALLPQSRLELIYQGYFGAASPKPTFLLCASAPSPLDDFGRSFRTRSNLPPPLAMGKSTSGAFTTFQLKEYPRGLNQLLAASFHWWTRRCQYLPTSLDHEQMNIINLFVSSIGQGHAGPDFCK